MTLTKYSKNKHEVAVRVPRGEEAGTRDSSRQASGSRDPREQEEGTRATQRQQELEVKGPWRGGAPAGRAG